MSNVAHLFLTPIGSLFLGMCIMLGLVSGGLSISIYFLLRHKSLLYFGISIFLVYLVIGMVNQDPQEIYDMGANPFLLRVVHFLVAITTYFFYRLVLATLSPVPNSKYFPADFFRISFVVAVISRVAVVIAPSGFLIRSASAIMVVFLLATIIYGLAYCSRVKSTRLIKLSFCLLSLGILHYPLYRTGFLPVASVAEYSPMILVGVLSVSAIIWLTGLIQLAKEKYESAEMASLKKMARAFIELRDLMNSPLQTIEFAANILREKTMSQNSSLERIENALLQMREINGLLGPYEKDVDWAQQDNFFSVQSLRNGKLP